MKNLVDFINESIMNIAEKKTKTAKTTFYNFIVWYTGEYRITKDVLEKADLLDAMSTEPEDYFDGNYKKLYDFYTKHKSTTIDVTITDAYGGFENDFEIENIKFNFVSGEDFDDSDFVIDRLAFKNVR
jgi:hypothetical protein